MSFEFVLSYLFSTRVHKAMAEGRQPWAGTGLCCEMWGQKDSWDSHGSTTWKHLTLSPILDVISRKTDLTLVLPMVPTLLELGLQSFKTGNLRNTVTGILQMATCSQEEQCRINGLEQRQRLPPSELHGRRASRGLRR